MAFMTSCCTASSMFMIRRMYSCLSSQLTAQPSTSCSIRPSSCLSPRSAVTLTCLAMTGKSQIKSQSKITNPLTKRVESLCQITNQITWNEIKSKSLEPKSQIKSNHDVNQMTTVPDSNLCAQCHQCTSGLTVIVSVKIREDTIFKINSLTQL